MKRAPCVAGRAITCWIAHLETDNSVFVIKDTWQYPERQEEGELSREATEKGMTNVARYYYHETVHIDGKEDDIRHNVRKGLDVTAKDRQPESRLYLSSIDLDPPGSSRSKAGHKRRYSTIDAALPSNKRNQLGPSIDTPSVPLKNRIHRRVIM